MGQSGGVDIRLLLIVLGWLAGWWLLWRVPRLRLAATSERPDPASRDREAAEVAVIIPARNEELSLPSLLASLARQRVRPGRVLVVDDASEDRTRAIAEEAGVEVITASSPPEGWLGKPWACEQGVRATSAPRLVFVDADVTLEPDALGAVLDRHDREGGLVSVQPHHRMERAYERFSAVFNIVSFMGIGGASPGRDGRATGAFGPVLCCDRADLDAVGGYQAVRADIVEDMALARRFLDTGLPVTALGGGPLISFRMYPGGFGSLIEGWSKNFATGAATAALGRVVLVFLWITASLTSVQLGLEQLFGHPGVPLGLVTAVYLLFALQYRLMLGQLGDFGAPTAALFPVPLGIFLLVFARSLWLTVVRRKVRWRGRDIPLSSSARRRTVDGAAPVPPRRGRR